MTSNATDTSTLGTKAPYVFEGRVSREMHLHVGSVVGVTVGAVGTAAGTFVGADGVLVGVRVGVEGITVG